MEKTSPEKCGVLAVLLFSVAPPCEAQVARKRPLQNLLAGRVTHDGRPVEGAQVHVLWLAHPELPGSLVSAIHPQPVQKILAKSKAKGRFRVGLPHRGPYAVFAAKGDGLRSALLFPVMAGDFRELALRPIPIAQGSVTDAAGRPVAGATVSQGPSADIPRSLEKYRCPYPTTTAKTDAGGRFRLPVWPIGTTQFHNLRSLRAWNDDYVSTERFYMATGRTDSDPALRLTRRTKAWAIVRDAAKKPIANALLRDPETGRAARSDANGRVVLKGVHSSFTLVDAPGYQLFTISSPPEAVPKNVTLRRGHDLDVRLVRAQGSFEGHRVVLATLQFDGPAGHAARVARVGKDGRLRVAGIARERPLSAFVECGGRFVQFLSLFPAPQGRTLQLGEVRVAEGRTVHGRVNSVDRQPVAGARVYLQPWIEGAATAGNGAALFRMTYTDRAGRFRFDGTIPGPLLLAVNAGTEGVQAVRVAATQDAKPIVVTMPKGGVLEGRAQDEKGEPAPFAEIQYIIRYPDVAQRLGLSPCYLLFKADAEGRFRIRGIPEPLDGTTYALFVRDGRGFRSLLTGTHTSPITHRVKYCSPRR